MPTHLDPIREGGHKCEYIHHPLGWTGHLLDDFQSTRCKTDADYQTREQPVRYLCATHAARARVPFRRANDQQLIHMAMEN